MALKRKRSSSELCSSPLSTTSTSTFGSPPGHRSMMLDVSPAPFFQPAHLPSRTMKRYRDSRPSEERVHQRTLGMLYSAQQNQPTATPAPVQEPQVDGWDEGKAHLTAWRSKGPLGLHRFWTISKSPDIISESGPGLPEPPTLVVNCEDCGSGLCSNESMDADDESSNTACTACGKHVCFSCSVSNLGEQKRCLKCASGNEWGRGSRNDADVMML